MRAFQKCLVVVLALLPQVVLAQSNRAAISAPHWKSTVEITIGGADADEKSTFGRMTGIAVDKSGRIFVADGQDNQIKVFSRDGAYASTIGRKGAGPLEFNRLAGLAFGPDQLLWARDETNARTLALDVSSNPPRVIKTMLLQNFSRGNHTPIVFDPAGLAIEEGTFYEKATDVFRPVVSRRTLTGVIASAETIAVPSNAFSGRHKVSRVQRDANGKEIGFSQSYAWQPYGPEWLRAYGPKGVRAEVVTSSYEIAVYDANGKLTRTIKHNVPAVALSSDEKRRADSTINFSKLPFSVPSTKAPVIGLKFTQEGHLWVERAVAEGRPREADIFDESGKLIATAEWPRNTEITRDYRSWISGNTVYAIMTGSDDLESIVRLKFK